MAKLILNPTLATRREITLNRDLLAIGRDPSNDLVLPDAMVSRRHAVIEYRSNQYYVRDCNSSNGSVVNGDRVSERSLRDGDLVAIGAARLLFREDLPDAGAKVVPHPSSHRLECPSCQNEYRKGDLFCRQCGTALAPSGPPRMACASCGSAVLLPARFCNACGTPLQPDGQRVEAPRAAPDAPRPSPPLLSTAPGAADLPPLDPEEPPTRPTGPAPILEPPPPDAPAGGRYEASIDDFRRGGSVPFAAAAPAMVLSDAAAAVRLRPLGPRAVHPTGAWRTAAAPAGFLPRLAAGLVDGLVVVSGQLLLLGPLAYYWSSLETGEVAFVPVLASVTLGVLALFLGAAYFVGFWGLRGTTPGKQLLGLRVTDEEGHAPIGPGRAALRFLGYLLSVASMGVGFLLIAVSGNGLHDRIARTHVVGERVGKKK
jgi:uncharacterized RDD family membrane protein YckC